MPQRRSLTNITSARPDKSASDQLLTPRTPHSRSGRAEEAYTEFELQQLGEDDDWQGHNQHQSVPLLSSSASESFPVQPTTGYRGRGDDYDISNGESWDKQKGQKKKLQISKVVDRVTIAMGSLLAGFLLFLIYVSYYRPEKLHHYLGISTSTKPMYPSTSNTSIDPQLLISYENYTIFPLRPKEYLI
ncbi:hypothetical protein H0H93_001100, partial [Arthromyces matolae]